eukprot:9476-Heterococcus_DN1.PRE.5
MLRSMWQEPTARMRCCWCCGTVCGSEHVGKVVSDAISKYNTLKLRQCVEAQQFSKSQLHDQ